MESSYEIFNFVIKQALRNYWGHEEYEDMYQECYLKILDVLSKNPYEPIYNLHGYAFCIARNTVHNYMHHYKKNPRVTFEEFPDIPVEAPFETQMILDEVFDKMLLKHTKLLPPDYTREHLLELILKEDPTNLQLRIVKGDTLWTLASYLDLRK